LVNFRDVTLFQRKYVLEKTLARGRANEVFAIVDLYRRVPITLTYLNTPDRNGFCRWLQVFLQSRPLSLYSVPLFFCLFFLVNVVAVLR